MQALDLGPMGRLGMWCVVLAAAGVMAGCTGDGATPLKAVCSAGETSCGSGSQSYCVNLKTDNANCGACGKACPTGEACTNGTCAMTCASDQTLCGTGAATFCASVQTDNANCGHCGTICPAGQACTNGACTVTCGTGLTACGTGANAYCANFQTDNANCGHCGTLCPAGQVCAGGTCGASCGPTLTACTGANGPYCANLNTDNGNCGHCGTTCPASTACVNGACCTPKTWFQDADGDGFGNPAVSVTSCPQPTGYVADNTDCDDTNPNVYPGAPELCDGVKDDCSNAAWTSDAGLATFEDATGTITDYTAKLAAGKAAAPVVVPLNTAGTLNVCAGTWYAGFTIGANVTIAGIGGRDAVILDGGNQQQLVASTSTTGTYALDVSGLTLTHGSTTGTGGAIDLVNPGTAKLTDVAVTDSTAKNGGGIFSAAPLELERVAISGNTATYTGGGLLTQGTVTGTWVQITGNNATPGQDSIAGEGGGWLIDTSFPNTVKVANLTVDGNTGAAGGGMVVRGSPSTPPVVTITGGDISGNNAVGPAGGLLTYQGKVTLTDVSLVGNRADTGTSKAGYFGGAANVVSGTVTLDGCTVQDNVDEFGVPPGVGGVYVMGTLKVNASHFGYNCIWLLSTHVCVTPSSTLTAADAVSSSSNNAYVFNEPATVTCDANSCN